MDQDKERSGDPTLAKQSRLLSWFFSSSVPPVPLEEERRDYPKTKVSNFFSQLFFWWLVPLIKVGYIRTVQPADLFRLTELNSVKSMGDRFRAALAKRCKGDGIHTRKSVIYSLTEVFAIQYGAACICLFLGTLSTTFNPLLVKQLILFVERRSVGAPYKIGDGIGYSIGIALLTAVNAFLNNHFLYRAQLTGAQVRAVLTEALFAKSCRLSNKSRHEFSLGVVTSLIGTDVSRIDLCLGYLPYIITFLPGIIIIIAFLIVNIGVSAVIGIVVLFLFCMGIFYMTTILKNIRKKSIVFTDQRINAIKEVLYNLKIIKYYSWEVPYFNSISEIRNKEMDLVLATQSLRNIFIAVGFTLNQLSYMVAFLVLYGINSGKVNAANIFTSITLFNVLNFQALFLPLVAPSASDGYIAIGRIADYLSAEEATTIGLLSNEELKLAIKIDDASFQWEVYGNEEDQDSKSVALENGFTLNDVLLSVERGEFIILLGSIGSGKSSLLQAIAGFMKCTKGAIEINDTSILCASNWVQNATIKDNILFGSEFDRVKYNKVLLVCCLEDDLKILPGGDLTEVGERGITLSGGQKARLSLARAIYKDRNIILLDDVLSAVDASVGKRITDECLMDFLKSKTRVLATHQISLIGAADKIVFMGKDRIYFDTLEQLNKIEEFRYFTKLGFIETHLEKSADIESIIDDIEEIKTTTTKETTTEKTAGDGKLVNAEGMTVNRVPFQVYREYVEAGSKNVSFWLVLPFVIFFVAFTQFALVFANVWLSFWTSNRFPNLSQGIYVGLYALITISGMVLLILEFAVLAYISTTASRVLNIKALESILKVPMLYIDTTPLGRILNRFTRDTDVLDNEFGAQLRLVVFQGANIVAIMILCIIYMPWFAIAVPFLFCIFIAMYDFYMGSAREIKRVDAVQRSFVFNSFNETIQGMDVIRAFKVEDMFYNKICQFIDNMDEAYFISIANQRWLGLSLDIGASMFVVLVCILCATRSFKISASSSGLIVSYVLNVASSLTVFLRSFTRVENEMNSIDRMTEYASRIVQEAPYTISETTPRPSWPEKGTIELHDVSLRYREGLPLVLKSLTVKFEGGQRIGICGRTGAGKSSIMAALFRIVELDSGKIFLDGTDTSQIGLTNLRLALSIIPQESVLFSGNIRRNLDPFNYFTDDELWDALRRSGLISRDEINAIKSGQGTASKFNLSRNVEEDGMNFSLGEKQLIALARALLRKTRVLVMDEATSSVDYNTDAAIQKTIREEFDCTVLCIAHRLRTILDFDKVLVLDNGSLAEFDTPIHLFQREGSIFREMCLKSNININDFK